MSKIPSEIICYVNSATYTLQVPNVTRNKLVFQVCIETSYPNIEGLEALRNESGDTEARLYACSALKLLSAEALSAKKCHIIQNYKKSTCVVSRSLSFEFETYK